MAGTFFQDRPETIKFRCFGKRSGRLPRMLAVGSARIGIFLITLAMARPLLAEVVTGIETVTITREQLGPYQPHFRPDLPRVVDAIVVQTNKFREQQKRPPLARNETLERTAQAFADNMARTDRYGHHADGKTVSQRAQDQKYELCLILENIALQFKSNGFNTGELARMFMAGWKNSPAHRRQMLHDDVMELGIGVAQSSHTGAFFAVQLFGRPKSAEFQFEVANPGDQPITYQLGENRHSIPPKQLLRHALCLPAELQLLDDEGQPVSGTALTPQPGDSFQVQRGPDGQLTLIKAAAATE